MPGPSNLYGVSTPVGPVVNIYSGVGSLACPAGTATVVCNTAPIVAPSAGYFYPMIWTYFPILFSATVPSNMLLGFNINGGSAVDNLQVDTALYVASVCVGYPALLVGAPSNTAWAGAGSVINLIVNPTTNPVTFRAYSCKMVTLLFRAADQ